MSNRSSNREMILLQYQRIQDLMDRDTAKLRIEIQRSPCAVTCYDCCRNTATLLLGEVEAQSIKQGLASLPQEIQQYIRQKAERTVRKLEQRGYQRKDVSELSTAAVNAIRGTPEAECPMLVSGVCTVYEHRPVICRIWGYPLTNNGEMTCCRKTFIGIRDLVKPVDYDHYWKTTHDLSSALGKSDKTPNCYVVLELLDSLDEETAPENRETHG